MANEKLLQLTISKVDSSIFSGEVVSVTLPGMDGELTVMGNHEPLITPLRAGTITIRTADGKEQTHEITSSGTLEISHNHATVLI